MLRVSGSDHGTDDDPCAEPRLAGGDLRNAQDLYTLSCYPGKALGHDWGRYIVTTPATETSEGEETRTCRRNDAHKQTRTIPKLPASTYGVSGEVHESDDKPAVGVKVTLVLGDRLIDSTKTDDKGKYSFGNVAPGVYNLVAERGGIIMTIKVEVVSKDVAVSTIIMPQGKTIPW